MTLLRSLLLKRYQSWPWPDPGPGQPLIPPYGGYQTAAGVPVDERIALTLSTVYACVRLVSEAVSTLPVDTYTGTGAERVALDPVPPLVAMPYPGMSFPEWVGRMMTSLLLAGNAYGKVVAVDRLGYPTSILPVHPRQVGVSRRDGELFYSFASMEPTRRWPLGTALHIPGIILAGADCGLSPVAYARQSIGLALAAERYGASLFGSGANPSGALKVPQTLTKDQAEELKTAWEIAHSGATRRPAVLTGGVEWESVSLSPDDSQFLETRAFETAEVARWFAVPGILIGDSSKQSSWAASIEALGIMFVTYTLRPWIVRLEGALSGMLPPPAYVRLNVSGLLRGDFATRYAGYAVSRQWGWHSVNDIRELEDEMPIGPEGDSYLTPLNMGALGGPNLPMFDRAGGPGARNGEVCFVDEVAQEILAAEVRHSDALVAAAAENDQLRAEVGALRRNRRITVTRDEYGRASGLEVEADDGSG